MSRELLGVIENPLRNALNMHPPMSAVMSPRASGSSSRPPRRTTLAQPPRERERESRPLANTQPMPEIRPWSTGINVTVCAPSLTCTACAGKRTASPSTPTLAGAKGCAPTVSIRRKPGCHGDNTDDDDNCTRRRRFIAEARIGCAMQVHQHERPTRWTPGWYGCEVHRMMSAERTLPCGAVQEGAC